MAVAATLYTGANMYLLGKLKRIPKGELKSLIYYKMLITLKHDINLVIDLSLQDGIDIIDKFINKEEMEEGYLGFYNTKTIYKLKGDKNE